MCASAFYIGNIEKSLEEHGLSMCTIVKKQSCTFCHDFVEITLPVHSLQESRRPSRHKCIVTKDLILSLQSCASQ